MTTAGAQTRDVRTPSSDVYGYSVFDQSSPECAFHFIDISASGTPLDLLGSGTEPASDDGGALLTLSEAFELYGESYSQLVVSSNGYLGPAPGLEAEDGGDFSNDCPLPAIPDNENSSVARICVYHSDLSGAVSGGDVRHEYFASCPRISSALPDEPCTVIQWSQWGLAFDPGNLEFQAVLYHTSSQVVVQIAANDSTGDSATIGLQNPDARSAALYGCDRPALAPPNTAVCFFDPRFPAGGPVADLFISKTDKADSLEAGASVTYSIVAANAGPSSVARATVSDGFPAFLEECSWTCVAEPGSSCTAGPVPGDISDPVVYLAPSGAVEYTAQCSVKESVAGELINTAHISPPITTSDPNPQNNQASDVSTIVGNDRIFSDGFESGDLDAWS